MRVQSLYRLGDVACNKWLVLFRYARKPILLPQAYVTLEHERYRKHGRSCRCGGEWWIRLRWQSARGGNV